MSDKYSHADRQVSTFESEARMLTSELDGLGRQIADLVKKRDRLIEQRDSMDISIRLLKNHEPKITLTEATAEELAAEIKKRVK